MTTIVIAAFIVPAAVLCAIGAVAFWIYEWAEGVMIRRARRRREKVSVLDFRIRPGAHPGVSGLHSVDFDVFDLRRRLASAAPENINQGVKHEIERRKRILDDASGPAS